MKIKLDENFGTRSQMIFQTAGHDVKTVKEEELSGISDAETGDHLTGLCVLN